MSQAKRVEGLGGRSSSGKSSSTANNFSSFEISKSEHGTDVSREGSAHPAARPTTNNKVPRRTKGTYLVFLCSRRLPYAWLLSWRCRFKTTS